MLDITEIEATVWATVAKPLDKEVETHITTYNELAKSLDSITAVAKGLFHIHSKRVLGSKWEEYCRGIGGSESTIAKQVALAKAHIEVDTPLPSSAGHYNTLKGDTPQEKSAHYVEVQKATQKVDPSRLDIANHKVIQENIKKLPPEAVSETKLKVIEAEIETVKPSYAELEAENRELKKELKKEKALKTKRNKEKAELKQRVDLTPLREAQKALEAYWTLYEQSMKNWADRTRKAHNSKFEAKFAHLENDLNGLNPFIVLGLTNEATLEEIKAKYRELAKLYHPDTENGNEDKFKEVAKAYQIIKKGLKNAK